MQQTLTLDEALQRAFAAYQQGRWPETEHLCRLVLAAAPAQFDALHLLGVIALNTQRAAEAQGLLAQACEVSPGSAEARNNLGAALAGLARREAALESYDGALRLRPAYPEAHNNRGVVLHQLKRYEDALAAYGKALALSPGYAEARFNRGAALQALLRYADAVEEYQQAIALKPDYAEAMFNCGVALQSLGRHAAAIDLLGRALGGDHGYDFLYGTWLSARMRICDWDGLPAEFSQLEARVGRQERALTPQVVAIPASAALQRKVLEAWTRAKHPAGHVLPPMPPRAAGRRIHIGYFSADFHDHATCNLMAELFERHDRSKFEVTAFSFGPDKRDAMRARVVAAFERFVDVRERPDAEVAALARTLGVDIAIDLKGHTEDARPGIFAERAAPVQVAYLGYPGTMGADYMDYIIADATVIPEAHRAHYTEKVVWLPDSYQANDSTRTISDRVFTRESARLPRTGVVFCCFNANYKVLPETFDVWMRILKRVEGSVLWLIEDNADAAANLRREAAGRGVEAGRLIFAERLPQAEHLARQRLADLFLDTLPCNAHTTTSDALWAGLPVLTCIGDTFAGRVAASLLNAIGLPGLVVETPEDYESLATALAKDPARLAALRRKLADNRLATPLFDAGRFARNIEAAYVAMHERHIAGAPPDHLAAGR
jgi:predicted O-linked N-acetylglucosamine transferase (SPINDLY family)